MISCYSADMLIFTKYKEIGVIFPCNVLPSDIKKTGIGFEFSILCSSDIYAYGYSWPESGDALHGITFSIPMTDR